MKSYSRKELSELLSVLVAAITNGKKGAYKIFKTKEV
jgi:hypothetical protein